MKFQMKSTFLVLLLSSAFWVSCSEKKNDEATPNTYSFSYVDNDGLILSSVLIFDATSKEEDVEVKDEKTGTSEVKAVQMTVYKPTVYQTQFLKKCEQTTRIGKVKSKYIIDSTPEDCTVSFTQASDLGLIDLKGILLKSLPDSEKITSNTESDIFVALPLNLVTSAQIVEVNIAGLPMNVIFNLASNKVIGVTEKLNATSSTTTQATVDAQDKHNMQNKQRFNRIVEALKKAGLYGKDDLSEEEIQKIKDIAKDL